MNKLLNKTLNQIQLEILSSLTTSERKRFNQLKPAGMENDQFNYHLKFLLEKNLVEKAEDGYGLTLQGKKFVSNMTLDGVVEDLFKVSIAAYVVREREGEHQMLLQRRSRYPYKGDVSSVSGKVRKGEHVEAAASRKLREETGLEAEFTCLGVLRKIRRNLDGTVFEDVIYHICFTEEPRGELNVSTEYGENFWDTYEHAIEYMNKNSDAGDVSRAVLKEVLAGNREPFYLVDDFTVENV